MPGGTPSGSTSTPNATPARYTYGMLKQLMTSRGVSDTDAGILAAIALAESGGNPKAINKRNSDGKWDYGLWQIHHKASDPQQFLTISGNADAAVSIFKRQGFGAWTTYNTGAYKKFLGGQSPFPAAIHDLNPAHALKGTVGAVEGAVGKVTSFLGTVVVDAGVGILALVLFILGMIILIGHSKSGQRIFSDAKSAGKTGVKVAVPEAGAALELKEKAQAIRADRINRQHAALQQRQAQSKVSAQGPSHPDHPLHKIWQFGQAREAAS